MEKIGVPGLDKKERLLAFFEARGHHNLVLLVVDMLDMRMDQLDYLIALFADRYEFASRVEPQTRKSWLQFHFPDGSIVCPIVRVLQPMDLHEVEKLQQALFEYRETRIHKGEPVRIDTCDKCQGRGCVACSGEGTTTTFVEMSEWETQAAITQI